MVPVHIRIGDGSGVDENRSGRDPELKWFNPAMGNNGGAGKRYHKGIMKWRVTKDWELPSLEHFSLRCGEGLALNFGGILFVFRVQARSSAFLQKSKI